MLGTFYMIFYLMFTKILCFRCFNQFIVKVKEHRVSSEAEIQGYGYFILVLKLLMLIKT